MWKLILQLHKGGSSSSSNTISEWKPNAYQKEVIGSASDENSVLGNLLGNQGYLNTSADLRNAATNQLSAYNNSALGNYDYASELASAQNQIAGAQAGYANLANGVLPSQFQANMEASLQRGVNNTVGNAINTLGNRGVLNSSVTNQAMNDISANVSDTMAQQYSNNIDTLGNIYNNQLNSSTAGMSAAQSAQNAAYAPSLDMLNAGIGAYNTASSVLGLGGTTSNVQSSSGGSGAMGAVAGLAGGVLGAFCFTGDTEIIMADGSGKDIKDVEVGDEVISIGGKDVADIGTVIEVQEPRMEKVYKVVCVNETERVSEVRASATQPFMDCLKNWIVLTELKVGDKLLGVGYVNSVEEAGEELVYDLKVDGPNNYIANGFVAHGAFDKEN